MSTSLKPTNFKTERNITTSSTNVINIMNLDRDKDKVSSRSFVMDRPNLVPDRSISSPVHEVIVRPIQHSQSQSSSIKKGFQCSSKLYITSFPGLFRVLNVVSLFVFY
jgi:hypothetical protein